MMTRKSSKKSILPWNVETKPLDVDTTEHAQGYDPKRMRLGSECRVIDDDFLRKEHNTMKRIITEHVKRYKLHHDPSLYEIICRPRKRQGG